MAVGGNAGVAQIRAVGAGGAHGADDRDAGPEIGSELFDGLHDLLVQWRGVLRTGPPSGVIEIPSSASTRLRVACTSSIGSPGRTRQLTVALARCGRAFTACPPWIWVATQVVRICAL